MVMMMMMMVVRMMKMKMMRMISSVLLCDCFGSQPPA